MIEFIGICLAVLTGVFVAYPLFQRRQPKVSFDDNHRAGELEARKAEIYAAIKDIDFDFQMGKLSPEDYDQLRSQYKAEAVTLLKRIDQMHGKRQGRRGLGRHGDTGRPSSAKFCQRCGQPLEPGDRFCSACGVKV